MEISQRYEEEKAQSVPTRHGVILKGVGGEYMILTDEGEQISATPRGLIRRTGKVPLPGDRVSLSGIDREGKNARIEVIHPRSSLFIRPALANLEIMIITCSIKNPEADLYLTDKLIIICLREQVQPVLCITKADSFPEGHQTIRNQYEAAGIPVFVLGFADEFEADFQGLKDMIRGKSVSFAGQSGTGKSTLTNRILQMSKMDVGAVSMKNLKGKHTTRHTELFAYQQGWIADTPGFMSLSLLDNQLSAEDIQKGYPEIYEKRNQCRFVGCRHVGEMGCSISEQTVDADRLKRYRALLVKLSDNEREAYD